MFWWLLQVKESDKQQILVKQLCVQTKQRFHILLSERSRSWPAECWLWLKTEVFYVYCAMCALGNSCELAKDLVLWFVAFLCCRSQAWAAREDGCCETSRTQLMKSDGAYLVKFLSGLPQTEHFLFIGGCVALSRKLKVEGKETLETHLTRTWSVYIPEFVPSQSREPAAFMSIHLNAL